MSDPTHTSRPSENPYRPYTGDAGRWEADRQRAIEKKRRDDDAHQQLLNTIASGSFHPTRSGGGSGSSSGSGGGVLAVVVIGFLALVFFQDDPRPPARTTASEPVVAPTPQPAEPHLEPTRDTVGSVAPAAPAPLTFAAAHQHGLRDCEGVLTFTPETVTYRTPHPDDSFSYTRADVALDGNGFRDPSGRAWHFKADGLDVEEAFRQWYAGELFDRARRATPEEPGEPPRAAEADAVAPRPPAHALPPPGEAQATAGDLRVAVRHKHRLRDCSGVLVLSADAVRFETRHPEDKFAYAKQDVELHNDGFRDPAGKAWHFTAEDHDIRVVFRRWKNGADPAGEVPR